MKRPSPPPQPGAPVSGRQLRLPLFYEGSIALGDEVQVLRQGDRVWYFVQGSPVYSHAVQDVASFRSFTSSLCDLGLCKLADVERAFSVSAISVKRALKQYRAGGSQVVLRESAAQGRAEGVVRGTCGGGAGVAR